MRLTEYTTQKLEQMLQELEKIYTGLGTKLMGFSKRLE